MRYLLCRKCKKVGFTRPSACCFSGYPKAGDYIEFLSDRQTDKGPSSGIITISSGEKILLKHSDCTEEFDVGDLVIVKKTKHRNGGILWICN